MRNVEEYHPVCTMHSLGSMFIGSIENTKDELVSISKTLVSYLTSLTTENTLYRGEGNANIVIALPQVNTFSKLQCTCLQNAIDYLFNFIKRNCDEN